MSGTGHLLREDIPTFVSLVYVGFDQFAGNVATVRHLREAIAAERMPPALAIGVSAGAEADASSDAVGSCVASPSAIIAP